jgi:hypothetical protein
MGVSPWLSSLLSLVVAAKKKKGFKMSSRLHSGLRGSQCRKHGSYSASHLERRSGSEEKIAHCTQIRRRVCRARPSRLSTALREYGFRLHKSQEYEVHRIHTKDNNPPGFLLQSDIDPRFVPPGCRCFDLGQRAGLAEGLPYAALWIAHPITDQGGR